MNAQLIINWLGDGIELNGPATDDAINSCEREINFKFPDDFKTFYKKLDGFKEWQMDSEMLSLWPLGKIVDEYDQSDFVPFCDYMINSHTISLSKIKSGIYKEYDQMLIICETFNEFLKHWQNKTMEYV